MKILVHNLVEGAIQRGLIDGYYQVKSTLTSSPSEEDELQAVRRILDIIWSELNTVIDFTDDDNWPEKAPVGFGSTASSLVDAVATTSENIDETDETGETDKRRVRLKKGLRRMSS